MQLLKQNPNKNKSFLFNNLKRNIRHKTSVSFTEVRNNLTNWADECYQIAKDSGLDASLNEIKNVLSWPNAKIIFAKKGNEKVGMLIYHQTRWVANHALVSIAAVKKKYQNKGIAYSMFEREFKNYIDAKVNIVCLTKNKIIPILLKKFARKHNLAIIIPQNNKGLADTLSNTTQKALDNMDFNYRISNGNVKLSDDTSAYFLTNMDYFKNKLYPKDRYKLYN